MQRLHRSAGSQSIQPVLRVSNYSLSYDTPSGPLDALKAVNLTIEKGDTLGLVGESGSGKSSLAWAIMRYLPANAVEGGGTIELSGENLRTKTPRQIFEIRGRRISMVFQDPSMSLNPTMRLGEQLSEVLVRHRGMSLRQAWSEGEAALARIGMARPADMMRRFPHEASGGEKQRVVIATAFACNPELIIFDEPTTALDAITAQQILELFNRLREETNVAALYISHDLGLVSRVAQDVAVIKSGEIVEAGSCEEVFRTPRDTYTRTLLAAVPHPSRRLGNTPPAPMTDPLLEVEDITVRYGRRSGLARTLRAPDRTHLGASQVNFSVLPGEVLGLVGESGSGKSTMARVLAGIEKFNGRIRLRGRDYTSRGQIDRDYRRAIQIVFQHPDASLNPRQRIGEILSRPLALYDIVPTAGQPERIGQLLEQVLLPPDYANRFPHQLSGGEKQRVAIARAFAANPSLVICDEITSSLDVSVQASIARLLVDLQRTTGTACIFIAHDLNLVRQLAHRIGVMYRGELVDLFAVADVDAPGRHSYTRALLGAMSIPDRDNLSFNSEQQGLAVRNAFL